MMDQDYILNRNEMQVRVREDLLPTALFINLYLLSARSNHTEFRFYDVYYVSVKLGISHN